MLYLKNKLEIDLNLFERNRPDLWPALIQDIKEQTPDVYKMHTNDETVQFLKEQYGGRLLVSIQDLNEKSQIIVMRAVKQKQGKSLEIMRPANFKNKRPDLWPEFLKQLKKKNKIMYEQTKSDQFDQIKWFVDDIPPKPQTIIIKATLEARTKANQ